ncbi:DUF3990 domain-containing protein (plasmid) [Haloimpatiens sp. FM7330]|uniref:DUF3990 domain-containing protein n=1 Tax=Haloimpatiens sp. FM7330 TaxID=3298610 RepID=UPI00362F8221
MNIYHGSDVIVERPKILESNRMLDFGMGFYTTSNKKQAIRWAEKVSLRNNTGKKFLSVYNFNIEKAQKELNIIEFTLPDEKWLDFITANRSGKEISEQYDIVIGPVADDNVYLTVKLFETGVLNKKEAVKRLKVEKLFNQILFHTEKSLVFCTFDHYEDLGVKSDG